MKIVVCVKLNKEELGPFDAAALECALESGAETIVLCMGPGSAVEPLRKISRLGPNRLILVSDPIYAGSDTLATASVLTEAIKRLEPDVVLCGRQSIDGDTAQVGPELAALLGYSLVTNVMELDLQELTARLNNTKLHDANLKDGKLIKGECRTRLGREMFELPVVMTLERVRELRFPSLRSKVREIELLDNRILGLEPDRCGILGSPTRVLKVFESDRGRRFCRFIQWGELLPLIEAARKKTPFNAKIPTSSNRLPEVWAIGKDVLPAAKAIAEHVVLLPKMSAVELVERVRQANPKVILWPADLWGRRTAPIAAALLRTGLCADCTSLEADESGHFYMFRPARAGNVLAKIECRTSPQMATVRIAGTTNADLLVAAGRGVTDQLEAVAALTKRLGGELGVARSLVDAGHAPYERQIGLTGRTVAPNVYLAIGISGAVQHTCAIENAGTVIAVNPDKNARIFDYADYGIIDTFNGKELD